MITQFNCQDSLTEESITYLSEVRSLGQVGGLGTKTQGARWGQAIATGSGKGEYKGTVLQESRCYDSQISP